MYDATINGVHRISFEQETLLSDLLRKAGVPFSMPCGGNGSCGKCKVVAKGSLSPLTEAERKRLSAQEIEAGIRLACIAKATGDVIISAEHYTTEVEVGFSLEEKNISADMADGLVIDIGTTTVAAVLYEKGTPVKTFAEPNDQAMFGADVISRMAYEKEHPGTLPEILENQIKNMISQCENHPNIVIVANTVMLHFLTGQSVLPMCAAPYTPVDLFGKSYLLWGKSCYLPPCVSAFVGADITAGILASRMTDQKETSMLVDLGTNGEIAYFDREKLHTASTAAGPAFEGAGICMGMPAKPGAVNHVFYENGNIRYTTIGNTTPVGICGAGLIDLVAVMLDCGALEETGALSETHPLCRTDGDGSLFFTLPDSDIILTAKDIRQIQLAKSAIHAGMRTLADSVDTLYIAGGFGNYLNTDNARRIGLLPDDFCKTEKILGNTALAGGTLLLFSQAERQKIQKISALCEPENLSGNPVFTELYMENMLF